MNLDRGIVHRQQDERDQGDAGDPVGLEPVGAGADRVAGVVAGAVGDDSGIPRVVFLDVEDDLHQVRADVRNLGEDTAGDPQGRRAERFTDGEADEARTGVVARDEQQDAQHHEQLDADEEHADAHAGAQRDRVDRIRHALEAGERGARVGEGVDADPEPGDAVTAADPDQAEEKNDGDLDGVHVLQDAEVEHHDDADERFENEDELALGHQIGLAGLVNELGDLEHRAMHRQVLQLREDHHAERQPEQADEEPDHEQRPAVDALKRRLAEVRKYQVGLAAGVLLGDRHRAACRRLRERHGRPRAREHRNHTGYPENLDH